MIHRYHRLLSGLIALVLSSVVFAADFPNRPVRIVVPFTAGGTLDVTARVIAAKLHDLWGQAVVIENRVGGNGAIGADNVVRSQADGYTLLYNGSLIVVTQQLQKTTFDMTKDLLPVVQPVVYWHVLCVSSKLPVNNFAELVELAKKQPGKLNYGSGGLGSSLHLYMERLKSNLKIDIAHIPYKGSGPALVDLVGGQINLMFDVFSTAAPLAKAGKLKPLAITSAERSPQFPEVPTMQQAGIKDFDAGTWFGLLAPSGLPPSVLNQLSVAVNDFLKDREVRDILSSQGALLKGGSPNEFKQFFLSEYEKWGRIVRSAGVKAD